MDKAVYKDVTIQSMMKGFQAMATCLAAMSVIAEDKTLFLLTDQKELVQERDELEEKVRSMEEECRRLEAVRFEDMKRAEDLAAELGSGKEKAYRLEVALHGVTSKLKTCEEEKQKLLENEQTLKIDVVEKYVSEFETTLAQVRILHEGIDLDAVGYFKEIVDGKIVSLPCD